MEKAREFYVNGVDQEISVKQPVLLRLLESVNVDIEQLKKNETCLPEPEG